MTTPAQTAIAFVSCPAEQADALAQGLVEARVAACVNLVPGVRSVYRWRGAVETSGETLLMIKYPAAGFDALLAKVLAAHPYELPEVVAVPLTQGHVPYLDWILASCR